MRSVLNCEEPIDSLSMLINGISLPQQDELDIGKSAIGIDTNVILRLAGSKESMNVIDYLDQKFQGPLILSSQAIQEFWNNHLSAIQTVGKKLEKMFNDLRKEADQLGPEFESFSPRIDTLLEEFEQQYGYIYEESTKHNVTEFLITLKKIAYLSSVNRMEFIPIAEARKKTKTPPGFCDNGHGDFFIWLELLNGALAALEEGSEFDRLIFVTDDVKKDWSRNGVAHPVLVAEVSKLLDKPFVILNSKQFIDAIRSQTQ